MVSSFFGYDNIVVSDLGATVDFFYLSKINNDCNLYNNKIGIV